MHDVGCWKGSTVARIGDREARGPKGGGTAEWTRNGAVREMVERGSDTHGPKAVYPNHHLPEH